MSKDEMTYYDVAKAMLDDHSFDNIPTDVMIRLRDDLSNIIEERECNPHTPPCYTYDTSVPIEWVMEVLNPAVKALGLDSGLGHIVWGYGPEDGICGKPTALCGVGKRILTEIERRRQQRQQQQQHV